MKIAVIGNTDHKEELLKQGIKDGTELLWLNNISELSNYKNVDAYVDLLFEETSIQQLKSLQTGIVIVNSVITTDLPENFVRINGWPTFLKRNLIEAAHVSDTLKVSDTCEEIFSCFNKKIEWTPNIPGFLSARVIAMIINEAYFALNEEVSTKNEIDLAMKLGTNYPYGPFEWSKLIGLKNIFSLLSELEKINSRYTPAPLLRKEASL